MELRGLLGTAAGTGQGRVLLPWLLKPEVAVEEGEKPPLTRAERRHSAAHIKKPGTINSKSTSEQDVHGHVEETDVHSRER